MIPSVDALQRHWKRSCWVILVWRQATSNEMVYPEVINNRWKIWNNKLLVHWDSDENLARIRSTVALIKKGCGCKTGCLSGRCKCKRSGSFCGPGCKCCTCYNLPGQDSRALELDGMEQSESDDECETNEEIDEMMDEIFGRQIEFNDNDSISIELYISDISDDNMDFQIVQEFL